MTDRSQTRHQRLAIVYGIMAIVLLLDIMQLWLLTATMSMYLGGNTRVVWPAAVASVVCLGLNLGLLRYLIRLDR